MARRFLGDDDLGWGRSDYRFYLGLGWSFATALSEPAFILLIFFFTCLANRSLRLFVFCPDRS